MPGSRCFSCKRTRPVTFSVRRQAGGNYRTAQRSYSSTMCSECVLSALPWVLGSSNTDGVDSRTIVSLAEQLLEQDPSLTATEWVRPADGPAWASMEPVERPASYFTDAFKAKRAAERAAREERQASRDTPRK